MRTSVLLAALSGATVFLGLPVARLRGASERSRAVLAMLAAGVLVFLMIEVGHHAVETVESGVTNGSLGDALRGASLFVIGFTIGLVGLAWLEGRRAHAPKASALEVATMIAAGIGLP